MQFAPTRAARAPLRVSAFADPASSRPRTTRLQVTVQRRVPYGHAVALVGDAPSLGEWDPARAALLQWSEGDVWQGELEVEGAAPGLEFKFVELRTDDGSVVEWAPGANVAVAARGAAVSVTDGWDAPATVVEEEVKAEAAVIAQPAAVVEVAAAPTPAAAVPTPSPPRPSPTAVATAVIATSAVDAAKPVAALTVPQLKAELKAAGLSTAGKKADLVARLQAARE